MGHSSQHGLLFFDRRIQLSGDLLLAVGGVAVAAAAGGRLLLSAPVAEHARRHGHLTFLANAKYAYAYLLYILLAVELNDIAAFTCGKLFGRRQFRSNISPKKTWAGSIGAVVVSLALVWALSFTRPHFSPLELTLLGLLVGIGGHCLERPRRCAVWSHRA